jgi:antitoxin VapB
MAMNIKNDKVERLAEELAHMTGESKTAAILRALEERKERVALGPSGKHRLAQALDSWKERSGPTSPENCWGGG